MENDLHDLDRFIAAQRTAYVLAIDELKNGRKRSHWIWFIFPQVVGLGHSTMAQRFAIASRPEAEAYLAHKVLGRRLTECTEAVLAHPDKTAPGIFGAPDDLKFRSSMTLFAEVGGNAPFKQAIEQFYKGDGDQRTIQILRRWSR